jgi:hypothetical protein
MSLYAGKNIDFIPYTKPIPKLKDLEWNKRYIIFNNIIINNIINLYFNIIEVYRI